MLQLSRAKPGNPASIYITVPRQHFMLNSIIIKPTYCLPDIYYKRVGIEVFKIEQMIILYLLAHNNCHVLISE